MSKLEVKYKPGNIVVIAGAEFVVLDIEKIGLSEYGDVLYVLSADIIGESSFGENCDYTMSELKNVIDKWFYEQHLYEFSVPKNVDLVEKDECSGYKAMETFASPLTLEEFQKYSKVIPHCQNCYWLASRREGSSNRAMMVNMRNRPVGDDCTKLRGVRPAFKIWSKFVGCINLNRVPTCYLLDEIRRRIETGEKE